MIILTLPYSTVSIERTFSVLRQIRGFERNRICEDSLEACLLVHQTIGCNDEFRITDEKDMLEPESTYINQPGNIKRMVRNPLSPEEFMGAFTRTKLDDDYSYNSPLIEINLSRNVSQENSQVLVKDKHLSDSE